MYSIYCRSFPEDKDMVEEYKQAVEKFGQIFVPWKNLFYFETFDMNMVLNILKQEKAFKIVKNVISPLTCYFSSENAIRQTFPFKLPMINFILQNSSPEILQRLHKTCKYFFLRASTPVCYNLEFRSSGKNVQKIEYNESSAIITNQILENRKHQKMFISTVLRCFSSNDRLTLSKCLSSIYQCDAKYITICGQNLTQTEIQFLICSKKVVELELSKTKILDAGGKKIMLEEILEFTPKITLFSADIVKCNSKTAQIISKLPFVNGIRFFSLLSISDDSLAAEDFAKFIREKVGQCGSVAVTFKRKVDADYVNAFAEICNNTPNPGQQKISIKSV